MQGVHHRAAHPALWSLLMVPAFVVDFVVASSIEAAAAREFGLNEGDLLLMAHGASAWVVFLLLVAAMAAPLVLGLWFAWRAVRGGGWVGWAALVLNAALLCVVLYGAFDQVRMTYWPQW
jgi:hypothetical protein